MSSAQLTGLVALLCLISTSVQQQDPVQDFCRRFGHQTTIIDDKLYEDGGLLNWNPISTYSQNYSNTWLSYQDLAHSSASGMPQLYANLSKNASVPNVSGGVLWGDDVNKRFYLFGGEYAAPTPPAATFNLYAYDVLNDYWTNLGPPGQSGISPVSFGAGVAISATGTGFYYGGWLSNASVAGWTGDAVATTGLVKYNMDGNSWTNNSGPDALRRAEGSMNYIPASDGGMLVYFGGVMQEANGTVVGQDMDEVFVYDILSGQWYTQKTTGTTPENRRRFCSGVTWPDDESSYNIYLYGGASMPSDNTPGYDDVYILTIPTFEWLKVYPTDGNLTGQYPHHSLTCNVVNKSQMLIIGGTFPLTQQCDAAPQWGTHNLVLGQQTDPDASPWQLFSPNLTTYAVPDIIVSAVGGGPTGGATKTQPSGGFDNPDLDILMTKRASVATRTPTRAVPGATGSSSSSSAQLGKSAIAGIAVGGAAVLVAALAAVCFFVRGRRLSNSAPQGRHPAPKSSAGGSSGYHNGTGSPWRSPRSNFSSIGGPQSPGSYGSPPSPFARRPSNINIQQGPAELPVSHGDEYEMDAMSNGGISGVVSQASPFDEYGRPWQPQLSVVHGVGHSPGSHLSSGGYPYSPESPSNPPQELSTDRRV